MRVDLVIQLGRLRTARRADSAALLVLLPLAACTPAPLRSADSVAPPPGGAAVDGTLDGEDEPPTPPRDTSEPSDSDTAAPTDTGTPADTDPPAPPATCSLGWGEDAFQPLAPGDPLPVVLGIQGGCHVDGAVRCEGIDPGRSLDETFVGTAGVEPAVRWQILDAHGAWLAGYGTPRYPAPVLRPMATPDGPALTGERLLFGACTGASWRDLAGVPARMVFEVTDRLGVHAQEEVDVVLALAGESTPP